MNDSFINSFWLNLGNKGYKVTCLLMGVPSSNFIRNISSDIYIRMVLGYPPFHRKTLMIYMSLLIQILNLFQNLIFVLFFFICLFQDIYKIGNLYFYKFRVSFIKINMNRFFYSQSSFLNNLNVLLKVEYVINMPSLSFYIKFFEVMFPVVKDKTFSPQRLVCEIYPTLFLNIAHRTRALELDLLRHNS